MGAPVASFDDFRGKLLEVRDRSAIFGFLLYDSRPSQQLVNHFARTQGDWIDELARSAGIYFFFPLRRDGERFRNPSIELLRIFKLGVSRLPGIILFAHPERQPGQQPPRRLHPAAGARLQRRQRLRADLHQAV